MDKKYEFLGGVHGEVLNLCLRCGVVVFSVSLHDEWHDGKKNNG